MRYRIEKTYVNRLLHSGKTLCFSHIHFYSSEREHPLSIAYTNLEDKYRDVEIEKDLKVFSVVIAYFLV